MCVCVCVCAGGTQVVGMSATLSNISDLASFLRADTFSSLFRPVRERGREGGREGKWECVCLPGGVEGVCEAGEESVLSGDCQWQCQSSALQRNHSPSAGTRVSLVAERLFTTLPLSLPPHQEEKTDPDQLVSLVTETLPQPCLVFCATKRLCQNAAILLSRHLHRSTPLL